MAALAERKPYLPLPGPLLNSITAATRHSAYMLFGNEGAMLHSVATWPAIIHLVGPPGAGKLTVATALVEEAAQRNRQVVLLDNHRSTNVVFAVLDVDGVRPVPQKAWDRVGEVREAVFRAIEELSPPDWSFVLTNVVVADEAADMALVGRLRGLASTRSSAYVPVEVRCETRELLRRVQLPHRRANMKWTDPDGVRTFLERRTLLVPAGSLLLDTTSQLPVDSARRVLDHLDGS